ncbi:hypothetical protein NL676_030330 [Syzygium grande]|nr:hypothetical protein NL676_030330 [Syzygium grande]
MSDPLLSSTAARPRRKWVMKMFCPCPTSLSPHILFLFPPSLLVSLRKPPLPCHVTTDDLFTLFPPPPPPDRPSSLRRSRRTSSCSTWRWGSPRAATAGPNLWRVSATHLFSPGRMAAFERFRAQTGLQRMGEIKCLTEEPGEVGARKVLPLCSPNNVMMGMLGEVLRLRHSQWPPRK